MTRGHWQLACVLLAVGCGIVVFLVMAWSFLQRPVPGPTWWAFGLILVGLVAGVIGLVIGAEGPS